MYLRDSKDLLVITGLDMSTDDLAQMSFRSFVGALNIVEINDECDTNLEIALSSDGCVRPMDRQPSSTSSRVRTPMVFGASSALRTPSGVIPFNDTEG
jgi:hypothetical protein